MKRIRGADMFSLRTFFLYIVWFALLVILAVASHAGELWLEIELNMFLWTAFILFCAFMLLSGLVGCEFESQRASRLGFTIFGYSAILALVFPPDVTALSTWGDLILRWISPPVPDSRESIPFLSFSARNMIDLILVSFAAVLGSIIGSSLSRGKKKVPNETKQQNAE